MIAERNIMHPDRLKILNVWVDAVTRKTAREKTRGFLQHGSRPHTILASNPEKNFSVPADPILNQVFKNADLLLPDGIGMVMAAGLLHGRKLERIPGSEFFFDICELACSGNYGVYIYGSKEWVNKSACDILKQRYPGLKIVGRSNGYVPPDEMPGLIDDINATGAEILFVALGSPRQEKWIATHISQLDAIKICQGVGGTIDTIAGNVKRAPRLWCRWNLEWLYRLLKEPTRIRRQKVLPRFVLGVLREWISRRKRMFT